MSISDHFVLTTCIKAEADMFSLHFIQAASVSMCPIDSVPGSHVSCTALHSRSLKVSGFSLHLLSVAVKIFCHWKRVFWYGTVNVNLFAQGSRYKNDQLRSYVISYLIRKKSMVWQNLSLGTPWNLLINCLCGETWKWLVSACLRMFGFKLICTHKTW